MPGGPKDRPWPILEDYPRAVAEIGDRWDNPLFAIGKNAEGGSLISLSQWNHHSGMLTLVGTRQGLARLGGHVGGDEIRTTLGAVLSFAFQCDGVFLLDKKPWVLFELWPVYESEIWRIRDWGEPRFSAEHCERQIVGTIQEAVQVYDRLSGALNGEDNAR